MLQILRDHWVEATKDDLVKASRITTNIRTSVHVTSIHGQVSLVSGVKLTVRQRWFHYLIRQMTLQAALSNEGRELLSPKLLMGSSWATC